MALQSSSSQSCKGLLTSCSSSVCVTSEEYMGYLLALLLWWILNIVKFRKKLANEESGSLFTMHVRWSWTWRLIRWKHGFQHHALVVLDSRSGLIGSTIIFCFCFVCVEKLRFWSKITIEVESILVRCAKCLPMISWLGNYTFCWIEYESSGLIWVLKMWWQCMERDP